MKLGDLTKFTIDTVLLVHSQVRWPPMPSHVSQHRRYWVRVPNSTSSVSPLTEEGGGA